MTSTALARIIAELALTKKAHDVVLIDLRGLTSMTDFFVVCSADSDVQMRAIADAVDEGMDQRGEGPWHKETGSPHWVLLDFVDVVLHVFHTSTRSYYNLEKLWGDATITPVTDIVPEKKLPVRRTAAKKPAAKKTPAKKSPRKKTIAKKKAPARKSSARRKAAP